MPRINHVNCAEAPPRMNQQPSSTVFDSTSWRSLPEPIRFKFFDGLCLVCWTGSVINNFILGPDVDSHFK